jgi:hypothetical protein
MCMSESEKAVRALPCPFCGSAMFEIGEGSTFRWRVPGCGECGATSGEVRIDTLPLKPQEQKELECRQRAIEQWNRRAALQSPDGGEQAVAWGVFWDDSGPLRVAHGWKFPVFKEKEAAEQFAYSVRIAEDGGPVKVLPLGLLSTSPAANIQARIYSPIASNDREMLLYLMQAFDGEAWQCEHCGHHEDTATMDSAGFLRDYLNAHPTPPQQAVAAEPVAWMAVSDDDERHLGFDKQDLYREVLRVYTMQPLYTAPFNADLLVGAAYQSVEQALLAAREDLKREGRHKLATELANCAALISTLTPDAARKELERVCMEVAEEVRLQICKAQRTTGDYYLSMDELVAIVHQVLSKGGER